MKNYTKKGFDIVIGGFVNVGKDNYNEGCLNQVNCWDLESNVLTDVKDIEKEKKEINKFILDYINYNLYKELKDLKNIDFGENNIYYGQEVNEDNEEPTQIEMEKWKNGEIDLYYQNLIFGVFINGIAIEEQDLQNILSL